MSIIYTTNILLQYTDDIELSHSIPSDDDVLIQPAASNSLHTYMRSDKQINYAFVLYICNRNIAKRKCTLMEES